MPSKHASVRRMKLCSFSFHSLAFATPAGMLLLSAESPAALGEWSRARPAPGGAVEDGGRAREAIEPNNSGLGQEKGQAGEGLGGLVTFGGEADVVSRYVWRGLAFSHDAAFQPSASVSAYDFTLRSWFNYELGRKSSEARFNEADLALEWSKSWGRFTFEPSVQSFLYPSPVASPDTAEGMVRVGWELGPVTLFTRHSFDLAAYAGSYFGEIGLDWERELHPRLGLEATLWLAGANDRFTEAYAGGPAGGFFGGGLELSLRWWVARGFYFRPHAGATVLGNERLRRQVGEPDLLWGGLACGFEF